MAAQHATARRELALDMWAAIDAFLAASEPEFRLAVADFIGQQAIKQALFMNRPRALDDVLAERAEHN